MKKQKTEKHYEIYMRIHFRHASAYFTFAYSPDHIHSIDHNWPVIEMNEKGAFVAINRAGRPYINKDTKPVLAYLAKFFRKKVGFMQYATLANESVDGLFGEIKKRKPRKRK